jgi:cytochrome c oxidase subunit 4
MPTVKTYLLVTAALMALLGATIAVTLVNTGPLHLVLTLLIAATKASLVVLVFMHVRWSSPLMRLFAVAGLVWLAILIALTMGDYATRTNWPMVRFPTGVATSKAAQEP